MYKPAKPKCFRPKNLKLNYFLKFITIPQVLFFYFGKRLKNATLNFIYDHDFIQFFTKYILFNCIFSKLRTSRCVATHELHVQNG